MQSGDLGLETPELRQTNQTGLSLPTSDPNDLHPHRCSSPTITALNSILPLIRSGSLFTRHYCFAAFPVCFSLRYPCQTMFEEVLIYLHRRSESLFNSPDSNCFVAQLFHHLRVMTLVFCLPCTGSPIPILTPHILHKPSFTNISVCLLEGQTVHSSLALHKPYNENRAVLIIPHFLPGRSLRDCVRVSLCSLVQADLSLHLRYQRPQPPPIL